MTARISRDSAERTNPDTKALLKVFVAVSPLNSSVIKRKKTRGTAVNRKILIMKRRIACLKKPFNCLTCMFDPLTLFGRNGIVVRFLLMRFLPQ